MNDQIDYSEIPSLHDARLFDAEMRLGRGWPEDVHEIVTNLDTDAMREFCAKVANVIQIRNGDVKGRAHLAANDLREWLAEQNTNRDER